MQTSNNLWISPASRTSRATDPGPNYLADECADVVSHGNPYRDTLPCLLGTPLPDDVS